MTDISPTINRRSSSSLSEPTVSSSMTARERAEARRAWRLQQVEMMELNAMGLGLERQDSIKLDGCLQQMKRLNNENLSKLSTLPKEEVQHHRQQQHQHQRNRFMGVFRRKDSDEEDNDDEEEDSDESDR